MKFIGTSMWPFNIFFKNEEKKDTNEVLEVDIKTVKERLISRITDEEKSFSEASSKQHSEILSVVGIIESGLETFNNSKVGNEQMDTRLLQILTGNKNIISKKIYDMCKKLKSLTGNDINSIIAYYENSYSTISDTISNSINNYGKIEDYLDRQIIPIFRNVNHIAGMLESFKKEIENFQLKNGNMKSLENLISKFETQISNKENLINKKLLLEKELESLEKERSSIKNQLTELTDTNEYREFSKLIGEVQTMKDELDKNRMLFLNHISILDRPIKKFLKLADDKEIVFVQEKDLSNFRNNQELTRENILLIRSAVEKMVSVIEKLKLKEEDRIKALDRMEEISNGETLNELYEEKLKIENKLRGMENLIMLKGPDKKFEVEKSLDKTSSDIDSVRKDLRTTEENLAGIGEEVEESKKGLSNGFKEIFNEDIHVKVN